MLPESAKLLQIHATNWEKYHYFKKKERGGEHKCSVFRMHLKLRGQQLKTVTYVKILPYKNLKVTANQNSITNIEKGVSVLLT